MSKKQTTITTSPQTKLTPVDYSALALATVGVGYFKPAPGTWGSAVGVLIYVAWRQIELSFGNVNTQLALTAVFLWVVSMVGFWASKRAEIILNEPDPQKVVIDEVVGQLITLAFLPLNVSWYWILLGFGLFRLFDIWKPYPIFQIQDLPDGIGVMIDDIIAGFYAGGVLLIILSFV
ncbi:MAG: phosphatidylglycerophosphatase A [Pyrinomonadaceae bacterium]|nr:phosphatidylglycerophosphatase A [Pyrinomonadaceae bacterium]